MIAPREASSEVTSSVSMREKPPFIEGVSRGASLYCVTKTKITFISEVPAVKDSEHTKFFLMGYTGATCEYFAVLKNEL